MKSIEDEIGGTILITFGPPLQEPLIMMGMRTCLGLMFLDATGYHTVNHVGNNAD